jgi:hypothetical protein
LHVPFSLPEIKLMTHTSALAQASCPESCLSDLPDLTRAGHASNGIYPGCDSALFV